jgi:hypothetical protein
MKRKRKRERKRLLHVGGTKSRQKEAKLFVSSWTGALRWLNGFSELRPRGPVER